MSHMRSVHRALYTLTLTLSLGTLYVLHYVRQMFHNRLTFSPLIIKDGKDKADLIDSKYLNYS